MSSRSIFLFGFGLGAWLSIWLTDPLYRFVFAYVMCAACLLSVTMERAQQRKGD
jgi:uncharacterized membrane protein YfcA